MKYSVIIPIYNSEKTLHRCLDSLLPQLNSDIEVILVNDGSTDKSASICNEYVAKNSCFHYYEQPNLGVSVARNKGIDKAKGKYIIFIDSDDYVSNEMFSKINNVFSDHDFDFLVFSIVTKNGNQETISQKTHFVSYDIDLIIPKISDMICKKQINGPVDKVYKRSIINEFQIRFPEQCSIAEDRAFNISYALHIKSLMVTDEYYYYAVVTSNDSLSRTVRSTDELLQQFGIEDDYISSALSNCDLGEPYIKQIRAADNFCKCRQVYSRAKRMNLRGADKKAILSGIRKDCAEVNTCNYFYPKTIYCMKIYMPVKFKQYWFIYKVAMSLAKNS